MILSCTVRLSVTLMSECTLHLSLMILSCTVRLSVTLMSECTLHRSFPFVLCYTGFEQAELCIDASISGNEMKNVRCSCSPNAKVCVFLVMRCCFLVS